MRAAGTFCGGGVGQFACAGACWIRSDARQKCSSGWDWTIVHARRWSCKAHNSGASLAKFYIDGIVAAGRFNRGQLECILVLLPRALPWKSLLPYLVLTTPRDAIITASRTKHTHFRFPSTLLFLVDRG